MRCRPNTERHTPARRSSYWRMISTLVLAEGLFEGTCCGGSGATEHGRPISLAPLSLAWIFSKLGASASLRTLQWLHQVSYFIHEVTFFTFLCFLPLGKHFHVVTSVFNVFFMRLKRGNVKPVRSRYQRRAVGRSGILWCQATGGFHLEAYPRFLLLRRLRSLLGQLSRPIPSGARCRRGLSVSRVAI